MSVWKRYKVAGLGGAAHSPRERVAGRGRGDILMLLPVTGRSGGNRKRTVVTMT